MGRMGVVAAGRGRVSRNGAKLATRGGLRAEAQGMPRGEERTVGCVWPAFVCFVCFVCFVGG
jgi:hypothetical protein